MTWPEKCALGSCRIRQRYLIYEANEYNSDKVFQNCFALSNLTKESKSCISKPQILTV